MGACLLRRDGDHWRLQAPAEGVGDVPRRYALFADRMIAGSRFVPLQSESLETGNVKDMRRPLKSVNSLLK